MLDNANVIAQRDPQDFLGFAGQQPQQLAHNFKNLQHASFNNTIHSVVFTGMGGSALAAELLRTWPQLKVPFVINKEYALPAFVDQHTLVICGSYSGNTEESIEALAHARDAHAQIAVITHGGKLAQIAKQHGDIVAEIPECPQPRVSVMYAYRATIDILIAANLVPRAAAKELESLVAPLTTAVRQWDSSVPEAQNFAKQVAHKMAGKTPIIYAGPLMYPAAYKWKISINENAKNTAWCNTLPESNHNEFIGWSSHPIEKPFAVIDLLSGFEHPRVMKRFEVTDKLLSGKRPAAVSVEAKGGSAHEHMLYLVLLGDFATTYLAMLNGINPAPVDLVEKLKKELA